MTGEPGKPTKHGRAACFPKPYRSLAILQLIRSLNPATDPAPRDRLSPFLLLLAWDRLKSWKRL